jgi:uncharacterized membrane protein
MRIEMRRLHELFGIVVAGLFLITMFPCPATGQQLQYKTVTIPGAVSAGVSSINDSGVIVGVYTTSRTGQWNGFMLAGEVLTTIDVPGAVDTMHYGINGSNEVVGTYGDTVGNNHAFLYQTGVFTDLVPPDSTYSIASGINDAGEIVGYYRGTDGIGRGFIFDGSSYQELSVPGATSIAWVGGINDTGEISFQWLDSSNRYRASLYNGSSYVALGVPGAFDTLSFGIDNRGDVALVWEDSHYAVHGAVRTASGLYYTVDDPAGLPGSTECFGINDQSTIVGSSWTKYSTSFGFKAKPTN